MESKSRKAQIWVETVIYTLIGLAVIGILLAVVNPKIEKMKDKLVIEQTIESLNNIDSKIKEVISRGPGNKRIVEVKVSKGILLIDSENDRIVWSLDSGYQYSEPDRTIALGNLKVLTKESTPYKIELSADYSADIVYDSMDLQKELSSAENPYTLIIENLGSSGERIKINLEAN